MKPLEIIILIVAISLVLFTIIFNIVKHKKNKSKKICSCDCEKCSYFTSCMEKKVKDENLNK